MLFRAAFHEGLLDGSITLTFRRWQTAQVKLGGRYRFGAEHAFEVDSVGLVRAGQISEDEARRSGFASLEALLTELGKRAPLDTDDSIYRMAFQVVRHADERRQLAEDADLSEEDAQALARRLDRMDALSTHGPWTRQTLALIGEQPRVLAARLAGQLGRERLPFKADVRKLKALGLTISHEIGYELSPRGRAFLLWERG